VRAFSARSSGSLDSSSPVAQAASWGGTAGNGPPLADHDRSGEQIADSLAAFVEQRADGGADPEGQIEVDDEAGKPAGQSVAEPDRPSVVANDPEPKSQLAE
jgi:hypothetical protein